ncbi:unnamed protein product [Symbiodinium sp. CCMP2592]|nr:unnamed protein product [Symbiodinium sp. CCMP2592]
MPEFAHPPCWAHFLRFAVHVKQGLHSGKCSATSDSQISPKLGFRAIDVLVALSAINIAELEGPVGEQSMTFNLAFVVGRASSNQEANECFLPLSLLACYAWHRVTMRSVLAEGMLDTIHFVQAGSPSAAEQKLNA